mmetsp:Transcript_25900/g.56769  ORF Transcript_25900/g.56769 Transcript_25900/m.56769 type:complete len:622 (+) Transcript_25900:159-2024(+)
MSNEGNDTSTSTSTSGEITQIKPAEVARQIKALLKELPEIRADAARLDELRRIFTRLEAAGELTFSSSSSSSSHSNSNSAKNNRKSSASVAVSAKWSSFLHKSHDAMVSQLCERVKLGRHASIRCLWGVIAGSPRTNGSNSKLGTGDNQQRPSSKSSSHKYVNADILSEWMWAMTLQESTEMDKGMRHMIEAEFFSPYRDVQYFSLGVISKIAASIYNNDDDDKGDNDDDNDKKTKLGGKLLELLLMIPVPSCDEDLENGKQFLFPPPLHVSPKDADTNTNTMEESGEDSDESEDESEDESSSSESSSDDNESSDRPKKRQKKEKTRALFAFQQTRMFRREYKKAWLAILRLPLPPASLKKALHVLPRTVLNYVAQPLRFADFFMQAYSDHGSGMIGVLALDGLFLLITKYGLEYENFYTQLYKLVSPRVMYSKYRARFYSLVTKCLVLNAMLPAHLIAAFIKRLCRCALSGPPSSALFVLALVSNLLKKHPECNCLVQRRSSKGEEGSTSTELLLEDCFVADADDPVECRALQSSLWELAVLERHYYPAVATLAKSIGRAEEDKAPLYNIEDEFANHTYASLFDQEKKKKQTKTALTFKKPSSLFADDDIFFGCVQTGEN